MAHQLKMLLGHYTNEQKRFIKNNRLIKVDHTLNAENRGGFNPIGSRLSNDYNIVPDKDIIEAILVKPSGKL